MRTHWLNFFWETKNTHERGPWEAPANSLATGGRLQLRWYLQAAKAKVFVSITR
jgi:hypothetical protein